MLNKIKSWQGKSEVQILKCTKIVKKSETFDIQDTGVTLLPYPGTFLSLFLQFRLVTQEALKTGSGICALCFACSEISSHQYEIQVVLDAELITDVAILMQSFSSKTLS